MGFTSGLRKKFGLPEQRVIERGQGCWNCKDWDMEKAVDLWWKSARGAMIAKGAQVAMNSPQGENDPRVKGIRTTVPQIDAGMESAVWGVCIGGHGDADFQASTYKCEHWTGKQGASLASLGRQDPLPQELMENLMAQNKKEGN